MARLTPSFQETAVPEASFTETLQNFFGLDMNSMIELVNVFEKLGLPLPVNQAEFMQGTEGILLFLNRYGVVIRIEPKDFKTCGADRVSKNPWVLQPIASIPLGDYLFEIYPGCIQETDQLMSDHLVDLLKTQKIYYWDKGPRNVGRMPYKTVQFPEGIPVVIDTGAVKRLTDDIEPVAQAMRKALESQTLDAAEAQEKLYASLRQKFDATWRDGNTNARKMRTFWKDCRSALKEGKLVTGWTQEIWATKRMWAESVGAAYEKRLSKPTWKQRLGAKLKRSGASAVPQSPHSPA